MKLINQYLASKLKEERARRKWSLDKTSLETGVSKAMLGQIERGESSPTVATLWKIATGFHLSLSHFLAPIHDALDQKENNAAKEALNKVHEISNEGLSIKTLSPYEKQLGFELFELILQPGFESISAPHDKGVIELVTVITGVMEICIDGKWTSLSKGEVVRFSADKPHGYRNKSMDITIFHNIIHYS
ncbi:XRE family transcriptional regulator [Paucibacter sp. O1-1]|nr:XRE family transcriptional regulator [Paucibacter sp. O1-1]MDA3830128.1 XRE family transcriptional regulator [Paucibacter sp. O1-1]